MGYCDLLFRTMVALTISAVASGCLVIDSGDHVSHDNHSVSPAPIANATTNSGGRVATLPADRLAESFSDGNDPLNRFEFHGDGKSKISIVPGGATPFSAHSLSRGMIEVVTEGGRNGAKITYAGADKPIDRWLNYNGVELDPSQWLARKYTSLKIVLKGDGSENFLLPKVKFEAGGNMTYAQYLGEFSLKEKEWREWVIPLADKSEILSKGNMWNFGCGARDGKADREFHFVIAKISLSREGGGETILFDAPDPSRKEAFVDFRESSRWSLLSRQTVQLHANAQYTLSASVRRNLGYGVIRLVAQACGKEPPVNVAEVEVIKRLNEPHTVSVVFAPKTDVAVRVGFLAQGYSELRIGEVILRRNDPPIPSYQTGIMLPPSSPTTQARYRTGAFFEAEDLVAEPEYVTADDADDDRRWAICQIDPDSNPWLFSENTVIKSDSRSVEDGNAMPPLKLTATGLLPGPYQVLLSDPQREAAVSLDGQKWRRVKGGAGEIDLGLLDVNGPFSLWVAHQLRTVDNPGPIYVDYLRFMPVYDAARKLEQPTAEASVTAPPPIQRTTLRLFSSIPSPRRQEWVTAGIPFPRGAFWPTDGVRVAGVSELTTRPLLFWPDQSVKWLRVEFRADRAGPGDAERLVEFGRDVPRASQPQTPVSVGAERRHTVRCGAMEAVVQNGVWDKLLLNGKELVTQAPSARLKTASGLFLDQLLVKTIKVENEGSHPTILVQGHLGAGGKPGPASFTAKLFEAAPQTLALRFSVVNEADERFAPEKGCGPAVPLTELTLVLNAVTIVPEKLLWPSGPAAFEGREQTLLQTGTGRSVEDFAGQYQLTQDGAPVQSGARTDGWVDLRQADQGLCVGVGEFTERCPKAISVKRSGNGTVIEIGVWPSQAGTLRYAQGTQLTIEVALTPHDGALSEIERTSRLAAILDPLRAVLPPEHYARTGIFGPITMTREPRFEGFYATADKTFKALTTQSMNYGIEDWGDFSAACGYVRTESNLWTNMEWDFVACLVLEFLRTGNIASLQYAERAARHFADIDIIHYSTKPGWTGGSYVHTGDTREGHQVDPPNFAHAGWPQGLLWVYYMAGDERLRDASVGLADYVVANMPPDGAYKSQPPFSMWNLTRQSGNPILTLASVYELTHNPKHLSALNRIVDFAVRVQDPKLGCWSVPDYGSPTYHEPSSGWGAVLDRGLYLYWQLTGDQRVVRAFQRIESYQLERGAPDTRQRFRSGSYHRVDFSFNAEACAFASLFSTDPAPLLAKGGNLLQATFPANSPKVLGARGVPGSLMAGARMAGAIAQHSAGNGQAVR